MAIQALKIRLGAPDSMILFSGQSNAVDLGASQGGGVLTYNPTNFAIEIDQALAPVTAYRVKEEVGFAVVVVQSMVSLILAAFAYNSAGVTTTAASTLATGPTCTVTNTGTGAATSYSYQVVPYNYNGDAVPAAATVFATGPVTLSAVNGLLISWANALGPAAGIAGFKIIRTAGGGSTGLIGSVGPSATSFTDTGIVATAYTASVAAPASPNVDIGYFGGTVNLQQGTFDWTVPKNDGTSNKWHGHLNKCYSSKQVQIDYKRDKSTDLNKIDLLGLADLTQPAGQQLGYLREFY